MKKIWLMLIISGGLGLISVGPVEAWTALPEQGIAKPIGQKINPELANDDDFESLTRVALEKEIAAAVEKELRRQMGQTLRDYKKESVYSPSSDILLDEPIPYIYMVPTWPRQALFFMDKDQISVDVGLQFATQGYGSSGGTKDISNLIFRESPIQIKDILLASKLIDDGAATAATGYDFLDVFRNNFLVFDASTNQQQVAFSYVRHFKRGDISLGLQVPLVRRENKIKLTSKLTPADYAKLASNTKFYTMYPDGLIDFVKDILSRKQIEFDERDSEVGIGDVLLFAHYEVPAKFCEKCIVGARVLFPTSKNRDIYKLWDPELGNGGFFEISLFGSLFFNSSRWCNPHLFAQGTYECAAHVFRRVPRWRSNTDISDITAAHTKFGDDFMIFGNNTKYVATDPAFDELDASVRRFSDYAMKTKICPGPTVDVRIGNMIENVFSERVFLDFFYDLHAKGRDYLGFRRAGDEYDASVVTENSYEIAHRLGIDVSKQVDDMWRLHLGALYTFAGRNVLRAFDLNFSVNLEF